MKEGIIPGLPRELQLMSLMGVGDCDTEMVHNSDTALLSLHFPTNSGLKLAQNED